MTAIEDACTLIAAGSCASEYQAIVTCAGGAGATYDCDDNGLPFPEGCGTQAEAYGTCEITAACTAVCPAVVTAAWSGMAIF